MKAKNQELFTKMTETPIKKLIPGLAIPTIISMLVTSIYNMADTYFVSKLGTSASGAVGVVFSIMAIMQAMGFLFGMGAGSNISRLLGQQKTEEANKVASSAVGITFCLGVIISILGIIFLEPLMNMLGATDTIAPYAQEYSKYIFIGAPFICTSFVLNNILRSQGKAALAMVGIAFGGILNVILDPLFIFTFDLGIGGAAIATIISQIVSFLILFSFFKTGKSIVVLSFKNISRKFDTYWLVIKTGLPSFSRQGLASIAAILLNTSAGVYGDSAVASMSIVARISFLITALMLGFGQGFQPVVGFNYGAQKFKRVRESFRFSLVVCTLVLTILSILCFIFSPKILAAFRKDDLAVIEAGSLALRLQCLAIPLQPITILCNMLLQSVGKPLEATFISSARQGIFFIPLILILPIFIGLLGVQVAQPIADVLSALCCIYFSLRFFRNLPKQNIL